MSSIRRLDITDSKEVAQLAELALDESPHTRGPDYDSRDMARIYLAAPGVVVWGAFDDKAGKLFGVVAGAVSFSHIVGSLVAQELWWYVHPDNRGGPTAIKLLRTLENWAMEEGADTLSIAHMSSQELGPLYERLGFERREVFYAKELTDARSN